jgi:hypothetical protein
MPKDGVTLPNGQHLPQGAWLGVPVPGIHNDERYYHEPEVYEPFRFVPSSLLDRNIAKGNATDAKECKPAILTTTSDTYFFHLDMRVTLGRFLTYSLSIDDRICVPN